MKYWIVLLGGSIVFFNYLNYEKNPPKLGVETIHWKDNTYMIVPRSGARYREVKKIAKGDKFSLFSVGDSTETFIGYRSFLDNFLYVKDDFKIPTEGQITKVAFGDEVFTTKDLCDTIFKILEESKELERHIYELKDPISVLKSDLVMRTLYVAYEGTYIPTEFKGRIGVINDKWAITTNVEYEEDKISYVFIPEKYISILKENFILKY